MMRIACLLLSFLLYASLGAQSIPSPDDFLPHRLGMQFTPHHLLVDYFQTVAEASPRVELLQYGKTNEDRPLLLAFVSSPENIARLEAIRLNNLRRAGLAAGAVDPSLDVAIVWLSYSVHGNEAPGSEASMGVLYDLANPQDPRASSWLENTLVIIDPSLNPDGYNRYTNWHRQMANKNIDPLPSVREHREPWPGGRVNHYLFDLNRDWAWQTQVESQQRMVQYRQWMPHIHADVHEQGYTSPYYFAPAAAPFHEYITEWQRNFQTDIGKNHAKYFDQAGWLYFTREQFDLLYPSYGDTYPTFNGAIGMTYEQAGHSRAGRAIQLPNGDTLTLADRVLHHRTTSMSTVEIAHQQKDKLVSEFGRFFSNSQRNPPGKYKGYVVSANNPTGKIRALTQLLDKNGIQYQELTAAANLSGYHYQDGQTANVALAAGDLLISAYQPRGLFTQVLFDPEAKLEDSLTYDITAWSLPHAYGLEAYAFTKKIELKSKDVALAPFKNPLQGMELDKVYAFILPWTDMSSARFLAALLNKGVQVRSATQAGAINGQNFPAGSLVINKGDNLKLAKFTSIIAETVAEQEVDIMPVTSGFSSNGHDLGSDSYPLIGLPKIALLAGKQFNANAFGQVWHFFEQDLQYPLHIYDYEDMSAVFEDGMNTLILSDGYFSLSESQRSQVSDWIRKGGKLIALGDANAALAGQSGFGLQEKDSEEEAQPDLLLPYGGAERRYISSYVPGAIVATEMDDTYSLSFGIGKQYFSLKTASDAYAYLENGVNAGRVRTNALSLGFIGSKARKNLEESLSFGVENKGRGQVVYLIDNPLFRGFWEQGKFLFTNALFQVQ